MEWVHSCVYKRGKNEERWNLSKVLIFFGKKLWKYFQEKVYGWYVMVKEWGTHSIFYVFNKYINLDFIVK